MSIIIGLCVTALGILMTIKSQKFFSIFGEIPWAEANIPGGSEGFYKLLGVVCALGGILGATGLFGNILLAVLRPLFGGAFK